MKKNKEPLSFTGFMVSGVVVVIAPALLASILPAHWKDLLLRVFGILLLCFALFLYAIGNGISNARKKKELEDWQNGGRGKVLARIAALRAEMLAYEQPAGTTPRAAQTPTTANGEEYDIVYRETPTGEKRQVGAARSEAGKGVELEINDGE